MKDFYVIQEKKIERVLKIKIHNPALKKKRLIPCSLTVESNAAHTQNKNGIDEEPFFILESLCISEIMPKEYVSSLKKSLRFFQMKYQSNIFDYEIDDRYLKLENVDRNYHPMAYVSTISIKSTSTLGKYFNMCLIDMASISESFVKINFYFKTNGKTKAKYNELAIKHLEPSNCYGIKKDISKLKENSYLSRIPVLDTWFKMHLLQTFNDEVKYIAKQAINSCFSYCLSNKQSKDFRALLYIATNIDKHSKENLQFWKALDISISTVFLNEKTDSCLLFCKDLICIQRSDVVDYTFVYQLYTKYGDFLALLNLEKDIDEHITVINKWMQKSEHSSLQVWLILMQEMERRTGYIRRFCREYEFNFVGDLNYVMKDGRNFEDTKLEEKKNNELKYYAKELCTLKDIVKDKIELKSTISSSDIQHTTFITNFLSALFALLAIIISLMSKDVTLMIVNAIVKSATMRNICILILLIILAWCFYRIIKHFFERYIIWYRFKR